MVGGRGIDTMPGQTMNIPNTAFTTISFNCLCLERLLSRMARPVRQALLQFRYRYVRERRGGIFRISPSHRIERRITKTLFEHLDYPLATQGTVTSREAHVLTTTPLGSLSGY